MIFSILIISIILSSMTILNYYNQNKIKSNYKNISLRKFKEKEFNNYYKAQANNLIEIYISGEVKNPGIIEVKKGLTLREIINEYILLNKNADLTNINLNKIINFKDRIIIPHKRK